MIGRILVALGGTEYTLVAIDTAVALAKQHNAELTGVTVMNTERLRRIGPVPMGAGDIAQQLRDERVALSREAAELVISRFQQACTEAGVKHSVLHEENDEAAHYLIQLSRYHDLAVIGLKAAFDYGVEGTASDPVKLLDRLITGGVRPIIAVPNTPFDAKRALIAYSGSMESARTLRHFLNSDPWPGVETRIVTFGKDNEENQALLSDAVAYCASHGRTVEAEVIDASPNKGLLEEADRWDADVIVLGNSHKSLLMRRVLGETVLHIVQNSEKALFLGQ
ncbi:Universal stress protein family protein [Posidoniimonas polymericola]|uniref:Universal stress protein family protein n=1 Tax=Posidoniimonas polymericola TaxID=2528002 RepID=A0A5C5YPV7_9BACT|nr:universal stress protein [Posidoniimonas polymericola]TWT76903.1 Universal stress protein family protein [Posidoniimonas polymericola]